MQATSARALYILYLFFFFNDTAITAIYTLSLHDALPIYEQDVVGAHVAVPGLDRGALDDRQQVALHTFARHIRADGAALAGDLVDLVDEDHAVVLHAVERF